MLDKLSKSSKFERMQFAQTKGSKNLGVKVQIIRDYLTDKGEKFKKIDVEKIKEEMKIK